MNGRDWLGVVLLLTMTACAPVPVEAPADTPATVAPTVAPEVAATATQVAEIDVAATYTIQEYAVPAGSHPHDVAPAPDGSVWYTAQATGELGRLDPATGATYHILLDPRARPLGVIVGPDGAPWITDGGLN